MATSEREALIKIQTKAGHLSSAIGQYLQKKATKTRVAEAFMETLASARELAQDDQCEEWAAALEAAAEKIEI